MNNSPVRRLHQRTREPEETISIIKSILDKLGVVVDEYQWDLPFLNIYCFNLRCPEYPFLVSSGKGASIHLAKASAYAEFIERLQSGIQLPRTYGLMPEYIKTIPTFTDRKRITFEEIPETIRKQCSFFNTSLSWGSKDQLYTQTYSDLFMQETTQLPVDLIHMSCGSNGVASGNNNHEALVHASLEVLERYAMQQVFQDSSPLPNVPHQVFENTHAYHLIQEIQNKGFDVIIKDATIKGRFPVIGVLLIKDLKVQYAFGADLDLDICLQRCLTEIFQEKQGDDIFHKMLDFKKLVYVKNSLPKTKEDRSIRDFLSVNIDAYIPSSLLIDETYDADTFLSPFIDLKSPTERWQYTQQLLKKEFEHVYIRNLSCLGFPTWRVFIPGVSEIHRFGRTLSFNIITNIEDIKQKLLCLPILNQSELKHLIHQIETALVIDGPMEDLLQIFMHLTDIQVSPKNNIAQLTLFSLLGILYIAIQNWEKANMYFSLALAYARKKQQVGKITYFTIMLLFIEGKNHGLEKQRIKQQLLRYFQWIDVQIVLPRLLEEPEKIFEYLKFPICKDCSVCSLQTDCYHNIYKRTAKHMEKLYATTSHKF